MVNMINGEKVSTRIRLRRKVDSSQERQMLIDLIMSDKVCKELLPGIITKNLESYSSQIIKWIKDYYEKEGKAPQLNIRDIFDNKKKGLDPSVASIIERLLASLDQEYKSYEDEELDRPTLAHKNYLKSTDWNGLADNIKRLSEQGKYKAIETLWKEFKPVFTGALNFRETFAHSLATIGYTMTRDLDDPIYQFSPWCQEGSYTVIAGDKSSGKSHLAILMSLCQTQYKGINTKLGPWTVEKTGGVLYFDGEIGSWEMTDRIRKLLDGYPEESRGKDKQPFDFISSDAMVNSGGDSLLISSEPVRNEIYTMLNQDDYKYRYRTLIFDNLSSLTIGIDENSAKDYSPINHFFNKLSGLGYTVIIIMHTTKDGKHQSGTHGHVDNVNNDLLVSSLLSQDKKKEKDIAKFKVSFPHGRRGTSKPFQIHITKEWDSDGEETWIWEAGEIVGGKGDKGPTITQRCQYLLMATDWRPVHIALVLETKTQNVNAAKKKAEKIGLMNINRVASFKGKNFIEEMEKEGLDWEDYASEEEFK